MKRDLGIYLGDADDTKRGVLFLNPTTGAIDVRLDFIKLELTDSQSAEERVENIARGL